MSQETFSKQDLKHLVELQSKEEGIQLLNWVLQVMGTGATLGMIRYRIYQKIEELKK